MNSKEVISKIQKTLHEVKSDENSTVSIDALYNYLDVLAHDAENDTIYQSLNHESKLTQFKADNDRNIAHRNNQAALSIEMFKSLITAGQSALKASTLINGGAAVALLAFAGKIWETKTTEIVANSLTSSILIFSTGVLLATIATGTTYLSQYAYSTDWIKTGHSINGISILCVLFSYGLFAFGAYSAADALGTHFGL